MSEEVLVMISALVVVGMLGGIVTIVLMLLLSVFTDVRKFTWFEERSAFLKHSRRMLVVYTVLFALFLIPFICLNGHVIYYPKYFS